MNISFIQIIAIMFFYFFFVWIFRLVFFIGILSLINAVKKSQSKKRKEKATNGQKNI
jgi:hypothetical protein